VGVANSLFLRVEGFERRLCVALNRTSRLSLVSRFFATVSRLADGPLWYALALAVALTEGAAGRAVALQMLVTGSVGFAIYKLLKRKLVRERPYVLNTGVHCIVAPLDRYSFPSGHTLHAVLFTTILVTHFPALAPMLVPFAALVGMSRVVLGLHYPSDVLAGAALGGALAWLSNFLLA
jgi:undecaprenyl-diphosphatase